MPCVKMYAALCVHCVILNSMTHSVDCSVDGIEFVFPSYEGHFMAIIFLWFGDYGVRFCLIFKDTTSF